MDQAIVLYDGVCNFCDKSVQFIIKRDPARHYRFASLQGETGRKLLAAHSLPDQMDSFVLIDNGRIYTKSDAALRICRRLSGLWRFGGLFLAVPRPVRDAVYSFIAKNRYRWFGKRDACLLPTPELRSRFLD